MMELSSYRHEKTPEDASGLIVAGTCRTYGLRR